MSDNEESTPGGELTLSDFAVNQFSKQTAADKPKRDKPDLLNTSKVMSPQAVELFASKGTGHAIKTKAAKYLLVVCPDGEYPELRVFPTAEDMAKAIHDLEEQEVCVWPVYGVYIPVTTGPNRNLLMPDGRALSISESPVYSDDALPDSEVEQYGYLGLYDLEPEDSVED